MLLLPLLLLRLLRLLLRLHSLLRLLQREAIGNPLRLHYLVWRQSQPVTHVAELHFLRGPRDSWVEQELRCLDQLLLRRSRHDYNYQQYKYQLYY